MTIPSLSPTRREVLAVAAVTVTLPMLDAALGSMRSACAAAPQKPAAPAAEKAGWFTTTLKPADVKDNEFAAIDGHAIVLSRSGKTVVALSNACTHKGCSISPKAGAKTLGPCRCHQAAFNLDGSVAKGPAATPLPHYAIRVSDKGVIEIDPGQKLAKDDKSASVTIS